MAELLLVKIMGYEENKNESLPEFHIGGVYRTRDGGMVKISERCRDSNGQEYWYGMFDTGDTCTWTLEGKDRRGNNKWDLLAYY